MDSFNGFTCNYLSPELESSVLFMSSLFLLWWLPLMCYIGIVDHEKWNINTHQMKSEKDFTPVTMTRVCGGCLVIKCHIFLFKLPVSPVSSLITVKIAGDEKCRQQFGRFDLMSGGLGTLPSSPHVCEHSDQADHSDS